MLTELSQVFLDNIAPILIVAAVGFVIGRRFEISMPTLSRIIFNVFSPMLAFQSLATSAVSLGEFVQLLVSMVTFAAIMTLLAYGIARWQKRDPIARTGVMLAAVCPNDGNLGLPLVDFVFGPVVLARAVMAYVVTAVLSNTLGVYIASSGRNPPRQALINVLRMPVVYAVVAGFAVNITGWVMPPLVGRSAALMAQAAVPCMLILLGVQLASLDSLKNVRLILTGTGIRLLIAPILAFMLVAVFQLQGPTALAFVMQTSMPVAVLTILFAAEFGLDKAQVVGTVLVSTLLSPITLSVLILVLRQSSL